MAVATLGKFLVLKKSFLVPFSYLLTDFSKLWTKIFGLISFMNLSKKIMTFCQNKPIYTYFLLVVHRPNINVLVDKLFFAQKLNFLPRGIRTHQDEYFELSYAKIGL